MMSKPAFRDEPIVNGRQLCMFAAFLMPVTKLLTVPSLLAEAKGDLLFPALLHFISQALVLGAILFLASKTDKSFFELLENTFGRIFAKNVYLLFAAYFVFSVLLPLLDMERFVYSAFFDTAPSMCTFCVFFVVAAFICTKNFKAFGRSADLCMPLFLLSFIGLMAMSVGVSDFSALLPVGKTPFSATLQSMKRTFLYFSDTALFLPLLGHYRYKKGDGKKVLFSYGLGALFVLFFLAVFFGIFSSIATKQTFAFVKTAQYFPALSVVGRFDFLLVYLMTVILVLYYCLVLQSATYCFCKAFEIKKKVLPAAILNLGLFFYTTLCNKNYHSLSSFFLEKFFWIFPLFACLVPVLCLFLRRGEKRKKETPHAQ